MSLTNVSYCSSHRNVLPPLRANCGFSPLWKAGKSRFKVFLSFWWWRAFAVKEAWSSPHPSSVSSRRFSSLLYLSDLWFHPSFTAAGDETESDTTSFFSRSPHRDKPFMFPSPSTTVSVSPSHCQQLHLPHLSSLGLPLFTDSTLGAHWLGWTGPKVDKRCAVWGCCVSFITKRRAHEKKRRSLSQSLDNQVFAGKRWEIKGSSCGGTERRCFSAQRSFGSLW